MNSVRNVLSLFDGISCGQLALQKSGIKYKNYYASEIDKNVIKITQNNFSNTIQLGDINNWKNWNIEWDNIDLLLAGFPCQAWSVAGKQLGINDSRGALALVLCDIFEFVKEQNPNLIFLFENVKMKKEYIDYLNNLFKCESILINSSLVSAQNRKRLYWTNIPNIIQPEDKGVLLKDIIHEKADLDYAIGESWVKWFVKHAEFQLSKSYCSLNPDKAITMTARQYASWNGNFILECLKEYIVPFDKTLQILDKEVERGKVGYFRKDSQANRVYYIHGKAVTLCGEAGGGAAKMEQYLMGCITPDRINKRQNGQRFNDGQKFYTLTAQDKHGILIEGYIRKLTPIECLTGETFILGVNKEIKDIKKGDVVLSKNGLQKVNHKFINDIENEDLYVIKAQGALPIKITKNHPVLVCERLTKVNRSLKISEPKWIKVEDLQEKKHYMLYPKIKGEYYSDIIDLNIYVKSHIRNLIKTRKTRGLPETIVINKDFCWLLGLCIAESSTNKESFEISLGKYEKQIIVKTQKILKDIGINSSLATQGNCTKVIGYSSVFSRLLNDIIGKGAINKKIPNFIFFNNKIELLVSLLDGYFDGDGHERLTKSNSHVKECVTVSQILAYQVQLGLLRLGHFSSIQSYIPKSNIVLGRVCNVKRKYTVRYLVKNKHHVRYKILDDYIAVPIQRITKEKYTGKVYNIETEDNTYLTSNLVVHNCERLQTIPDNYTNCVSNSQRYKCLGNAWTVDVISHILKGLNCE